MRDSKQYDDAVITDRLSGRRSKRFRQLAAAAALVIALALAGCGDGNGNGTETTETTEPTTTAEETTTTEAVTGVDVGDLPIVPTAKIVETWEAPLFNFPSQNMVGRFTQIRKGVDADEVLAAQRAQLERADWNVSEVVADNVVADADGMCDPRVFSVVGDGAALESLEAGRILVADSPDGSVRTVYYVGSAEGLPNFMYKARGEWIELSALRAVGGDTLTTIAAPHEYSRGILWGNFTDGFGEGVTRDDSPACEKDLAIEPFEIG